MATSGLTFAIAMPIGPSADGHPLLEQALRSIAAQAAPVRLAVLDASGSAHVARLLDRFHDIIHPRRTGRDDGQAAAIQEGWDSVHGDVYGWLNADDILYPNALQTTSAHFAEHAQLGVVTGQSLFFDLDPKDRTYRVFGLHPEVRTPGDDLFRTNTISQPSTFVRKAALETVGWLDRSLHYTMDWDLWVRLYAAGIPFGFEPGVLSGVLMTPGTKTSQFNTERKREIADLVSRHAGWLSARKTLAAFWLTHRAEAERGRGIYTALRDHLQTRTPESAGAQATSQAWAFAHYEDGPLTCTSMDGSDRVEPSTVAMLRPNANQPVQLRPA